MPNLKTFFPPPGEFILLQNFRQWQRGWSWRDLAEIGGKCGGHTWVTVTPKDVGFGSRLIFASFRSVVKETKKTSKSKVVDDLKATT